MWGLADPLCFTNEPTRQQFTKLVLMQHFINPLC